MKNKFSLILICFLLLAFSDAKQYDLPEIPVNIDQNISLPLSEITDEIISVDLELTDESLINPDRIKRVFIGEDYVIIAELEKILVFSKDGKFVRPIGSKGQGPGEYTGIRSIAIDEKNRRLFVNSISKIICYDLNGKCIRESNTARGWSFNDMNYINDELLLVAEQPGRKDEKGLFKHSALIRMNNGLQIMDSCVIRNTYFRQTGLYIHPFEDFILSGNSKVSLYCSDIYYNEQNPVETVLRDTLYRLEKNNLVPLLKLKFKNNGIDWKGNKFIQLFNVYRSSRYVFAVYGNTLNNNYYRFCYDTKTGKGFNMQNGFTDDIHKIEKLVSIRPLNTNSELFYYWHTHMKSDDLEEPNPTLYIGKLKKMTAK